MCWFRQIRGCFYLQTQRNWHSLRIEKNIQVNDKRIQYDLAVYPRAAYPLHPRPSKHRETVYSFR